MSRSQRKLKQWKPRTPIAMNTGTRNHGSLKDYKRMKKVLDYENDSLPVWTR